MKKKFETTHIEQYFHVTNNIAPIYNEEKVHQIISRPDAKARLKGKNRNLLKFTVMTTIFAVILSAVLFWTGSFKEIPNSNDQIPNTVSQTNSQLPDLKGGKATNNIDDFSLTNSLKSKEEHKTDTSKGTIVEPLVLPNAIACITPTQGDEGVEVGVSSIPIDGSRFVLKLSKEELAKIGIKISNNSIIYKNTANGYCYEYGIRANKAYIQKAPDSYIFPKDEKGRKYQNHLEEISFVRRDRVKNEIQAFNNNTKPEVIHGSTPDYSFYYEIPNDTVRPTRLNFYPVFKTTEYFGDVMGNETLNVSDFEMANDTLVPIVFPTMEGSSATETILWFVLSNQLYEILAINHKPLMDELIQYKTVKKRFPQKNIIEYRSPFLIDESKILKLSQNELQKMGFDFYPDSTIYNGKNSRCQFKVMLKEKSSTIRTMEYDELQIPELNDGCLALFVTDNSGNPLCYSLGLLPILFPNEDEIYKQIPLLIPVEVKGGGFSNSLFFWFLPNENFFKALSKEVSTEIKAEYDYVVAEDKSTLEKPECKFFEECKNTLKVSSFKVYPNPASANATVSFTLPEAINGRITLVDLVGRERQVLQPQSSFAKGTHRIDIDVSSVPEGIYLLTLYSDKGVQTQRLIVAR
jgi:hypothetical protein